MKKLQLSVHNILVNGGQSRHHQLRKGIVDLPRKFPADCREERLSVRITIKIVWKLSGYG